VDFPPPDASARVSAASGLAADCGGVPVSGTLYADAEVEPHVAVDPANPNRLVGAWQQNRFSSGAAQALFAAFSVDGGVTWARSTAAVSRCTGGSAANGGNYERATDPWVTFAPDGTAYLMSLSLSGAAFAAGSASAMLVARSTDGGRTWSEPVTLIRDGANAFNDKNTITADSTDPAYVYAVWGRLGAAGGGPATFARTIDGGATWEPARTIYDPGPAAQTLGSVIAVVAAGPARGTVVVFTTRLGAVGGTLTAQLELIRSTDRGVTWSAPIAVSSILSIGAADPQTRLAVRDGAGLAQVAAAPNGDLYAVWQDARFSSGQVDGVALSRSTDGGLTWSAPVQVNAVRTTQAFTPTVHVRADGTVGVTYFDFRSDTSDAGTLPTELWLARSTDGGATWSETRVAGPFDLLLAPNARGLFLGDYHGLTSVGASFVPFFAQTTRDGAANRSDIFGRPVVGFAAAARVHVARAGDGRAPDGTFRQRVGARLARVLDDRHPGRARLLLQRAAEPAVDASTAAGQARADSR
jgi:hypothetical protein